MTKHEMEVLLLDHVTRLDHIRAALVKRDVSLAGAAELARVELARLRRMLGESKAEELPYVRDE